MLILKLEQEKYNMSQEHLIGSVRICSKYDEHKPKEYRSWFEVAPTDQNWNDQIGFECASYQVY